MSNVTDFYKHTIQKATSHVSPTILRRAAMLFAEDSSNDLGSTILRNVEDVPNDVADLLLSTGDPDILVMWISREGQTTDEILPRIKGERRVAVLSALSQNENLPSEVFDTILAVSKSVDLLSDIVGNSAASEETRKAAARKVLASLEKSKQSDSVKSKKLNYFVQSLRRAELSETILTETKEPWIIVQLLGMGAVTYGSSDILRRHVVSSVKEAFEGSVTEAAAVVSEAKELAAPETSFSSIAYNNPQAAKLRERYNEAVGLWAHMASIKMAFDSGSLELDEGFKSTLEKLAELSTVDGFSTREFGFYTWSPIGRAHHSVPEIIASSEESKATPISQITSEAELRSRIESARSNNLDFDYLSALTHEKMSAILLADCFAWIPVRLEVETLKELFSQKRYKLIVDMSVRESFRSFRHFYDQDILALVSSEDREEFFGAIYSYGREVATEAGQWEILLVHLLRSFPEKKLFNELPIEFLLSNSHTLSSDDRIEILNQLEELLGSDDAAWSVFETFLNDGGLTLGEAAEAAAAI